MPLENSPSSPSFFITAEAMTGRRDDCLAVCAKGLTLREVVSRSPTRLSTAEQYELAVCRALLMSRGDVVICGGASREAGLM